MIGTIKQEKQPKPKVQQETDTKINYRQKHHQYCKALKLKYSS